MARQQFLSGPADCQWLRETHLKAVPDVPTFASFVLYGNEDCPDGLDLYGSADPFYRDPPIAIYRQDGNGDLEQGKGV